MFCTLREVMLRLNTSSPTFTMTWVASQPWSMFQVAAKAHAEHDDGAALGHAEVHKHFGEVDTTESSFTSLVCLIRIDCIWPISRTFVCRRHVKVSASYTGCKGSAEIQLELKLPRSSWPSRGHWFVAYLNLCIIAFIYEIPNEPFGIPDAQHEHLYP